METFPSWLCEEVIQFPIKYLTFTFDSDKPVSLIRKRGYTVGNHLKTVGILYSHDIGESITY